MTTRLTSSTRTRSPSCGWCGTIDGLAILRFGVKLESKVASMALFDVAGARQVVSADLGAASKRIRGFEDDEWTRPTRCE